jgi:hypothetical protein
VITGLDAYHLVRQALLAYWFTLVDEGKLSSYQRPFWRMLEVVEYDKTAKVFTVPADFCGPEAVTVALEDCFKLIEARYGAKRLQTLISEDEDYRKRNGGT